MFILYAVAAGVIVGLATNGRAANLAALPLRWPGLIVAGIVAQLMLFSAPVSQRVGDSGPALYVGTTLLVFVAIIRNVSIGGMPLVLAGAACNLTAVIANGGFMPASRAALEASGRATPGVYYSNTSSVPDPALWPLTDIFALPSWVPLANVFSVGDVLIGIGIALVIALATRRPAQVVLRPG
jgi:hypothetical protein